MKRWIYLMAVMAAMFCMPVQAAIDVYDFDPFAWQAPVASLNALYAWGREQLAREELIQEHTDRIVVRAPIHGPMESPGLFRGNVGPEAVDSPRDRDLVTVLAHSAC